MKEEDWLMWPSLAVIIISVLLYNYHKKEIIDCNVEQHREEIRSAERTKHAIQTFESLAVREGYSKRHPDMGRGSLYIF